MQEKTNTYKNDNKTKNILFPKIETRNFVIIESIDNNGNTEEILVCSPISEKHRKKFSAQLFIREKKKHNIELLDKTIRTFINNFRPSDLFTNTTLNLSETILKETVYFRGYKLQSWREKNRTYYTYKITATDSNKYYIGVSHVKKEKANAEDCLNDGYYGSGGNKSPNNKFLNWRKKHKNSIKKEIIGIFEYKSEAYNEEKELVADKWLKDPLCLNSLGGGYSLTFKSKTESSITIKTCLKHGETKHNGEKCCLCLNENNITTQECPKHGETKHIGNKCRKCINENNITIQDCPKHGETKHIGNKCFKCRKNNHNPNARKVPINERKYTEKICAHCQKNFTPKTARQVFCDEPHTIKCNSCHKEMQASHQNPKKARRACDECIKSGKAYNKTDNTKKCKICLESFVPKTNRQEICEKIHYRKCDCCGKSYVHKAPYRNKSCSKSCSRKLYMMKNSPLSS